MEGAATARRGDWSREVLVGRLGALVSKGEEFVTICRVCTLVVVEEKEDGME